MPVNALLSLSPSDNLSQWARGHGFDSLSKSLCNEHNPIDLYILYSNVLYVIALIEIPFTGDTSALLKLLQEKMKDYNENCSILC